MASLDHSSKVPGIRGADVLVKDVSKVFGRGRGAGGRPGGGGG